MFESYKLKKAKAKLELESINKQLNEIESQKVQSEKTGDHLIYYKLVISLIATIIVVLGLYFVGDVFTKGIVPYEIMNYLPKLNESSLDTMGVIVIALFVFVLIYSFLV